jgi:hypothetical protein
MTVTRSKAMKIDGIEHGSKAQGSPHDLEGPNPVQNYGFEGSKSALRHVGRVISKVKSELADPIFT